MHSTVTESRLKGLVLIIIVRKGRHVDCLWCQLARKHTRRNAKRGLANKLVNCFNFKHSCKLTME